MLGSKLWSCIECHVQGKVHPPASHGGPSDLEVGETAKVCNQLLPSAYPHAGVFGYIPPSFDVNAPEQ